MFSAEGRTVAEERQGGGGGFSAPSFNIPFQPNFQFNEFGSFLDGNGGFSQFISGLGSQVGCCPILTSNNQNLIDS